MTGAILQMPRGQFVGVIQRADETFVDLVDLGVRMKPVDGGGEAIPIVFAVPQAMYWPEDESDGSGEVLR
jgi:hypothetical protein